MPVINFKKDWEVRKNAYKRYVLKYQNSNRQKYPKVHGVRTQPLGASVQTPHAGIAITDF